MAGGLQLTPSYQLVSVRPSARPPHRAAACNSAWSRPSLALARTRSPIVIYSNAIPQIRAEVASGAMELGQIKSGEQQARINSQIAPYLPDTQTLAKGEIGVTDLRLETFPSYARAEGRVFAADRATARGA